MRGWTECDHRPIRLQPRPFAIIFPQEAASEELAGKSNHEQKVDCELEEAKEPNFFFGGWISLFRTNLFPSRKLLFALLLALQPGLVQPLLFEFVFVVASARLNTREDTSSQGTYTRKGWFAAFLDTILSGSPGSGTISSVGCGFGALPLGFQSQDILGNVDSRAQ